MAGPGMQSAFPVSIRLRVIGRQRPDLPEALAEVIQRHLPAVDLAAMVVRPSRDGNYVSVMLPIWVESQVQLQEVYRELQAHEAVILVL